MPEWLSPMPLDRDAALSINRREAPTPLITPAPRKPPWSLHSAAAGRLAPEVPSNLASCSRLGRAGLKIVITLDEAANYPPCAALRTFLPRFSVLTAAGQDPGTVRAENARRRWSATSRARPRACPAGVSGSLLTRLPHSGGARLERASITANGPYRTRS